MLQRRPSTAKNHLLNLAFEPTLEGGGDYDGRGGGARSVGGDDMRGLEPSLEQPKSVPNAIFKQGIREHADLLGMTLPADEEHIWIAEESLLAPLPEGWVQLKDEDSGHPYYYNQVTAASSWEHPKDDFYRNLFKQRKAAAAAGKAVPSRGALSAAWGSGSSGGHHRLGSGNNATLSSQQPAPWLDFNSNNSGGLGDTLDVLNLGSDTGPEDEAELHTARLEAQRLKAELRKARSAKDNVVARKEDTIRRLGEEKEELEARIDVLEDALEEETSKNNLASKQERQQLKLRDKLDRERAAKEQAVTRLEAEVAKLEGLVEEESKRAGDVVVEMDKLRTEMQGKEALLKAQEKGMRKLQKMAKESKNSDEGELQAARESALQAEEEQLRAKLDFELAEVRREADRRVKEQIEQGKQQAAELQQELLKSQEALSQQAVRMEEMAAAAQHAQPAELADLKEQVRELKTKLVEGEAKRDELLAEMAVKDGSTRQVAVLQREKEEAQNQVNEMHERFSSQLALLNEEMAEKEASLEEKISSETRLLKELEDLSAAKARTTAALEEEMQILRRGKARLEADDTAYTQKLKTQQEQVKALSEQLEHMPQVEASLQQVSRENASLTTDLQKAHDKTSTLEASLDELRSQLAEKKGLINSEKKNSLLWGEKTTTMEKEFVEAKAALAASQGEIEALRKKMNTGESKSNDEDKAAIKALQRERDLLQQRADSTEKRCDKMQDQAEQKELRHREELDKARGREESMWAQLQQVSQQFASSAAQLSAAKAQPVVSEDNQAENERLKKKLEEASSKVEAARRAERDAEHEKERSMRDAKELEAELEGLKDKLGKKKEKAALIKAKLEGECQELYTAAQKAQAREETLRSQVREAEAALEEHKAKASAAISAGSEAELKRDSEQVAVIRQELHTSEARRREAEEALSITRARLATVETEREGLEGSLERLKMQFTEMEERSRGALRDHDALLAELQGARQELRGLLGQMQGLRDKADKERALRRVLHEKVLDLQGNIRVFCRLRPLQEQELAAIARDDEYDDPMQSITYPDHDKLSFYGAPYEFDQVFSPSTGQGQVFEEMQHVVASSLNGYNVCVFAYGQTGSGKTYTMEGPKQDRGVNFRALKELFDLARDDSTKKYQFKVSMLEVYNEKIKDLLREHTSSDESLDIRMDKRGKVYVDGLVDCQVQALDEVEELISMGGTNRTVGNNNVNLHSSRSHLVFQVRITAMDVISGHVSTGKLNLIDLAGSERIKSTAAEGQRLKEAQNINRSLSALGDVINALGVSSSKHVPYRNSKLTFLLQDSLTASAKVLMFVNINPAPQSQSESVCSLNFAKRCKAVQLGTARKLATRQQGL